MVCVVYKSCDFKGKSYKTYANILNNKNIIQANKVGSNTEILIFKREMKEGMRELGRLAYDLRTGDLTSDIVSSLRSKIELIRNRFIENYQIDDLKQSSCSYVKRALRYFSLMEMNCEKHEIGWVVSEEHERSSNIDSLDSIDPGSRQQEYFVPIYI